MANNRGMIAKNIAAMLHDGDFVNLGIGIPTMVGNYIPKGISVLLHGENGCIGQDKELNTPELFDTRESVMSWMSAHREETDTWRTGHKDLNNCRRESRKLDRARENDQWYGGSHGFSQWS